MATEKEQSLQRRPGLVPEKLMRGGLIVGVGQGIQGPLMNVTGAAIERITRERTEVPRHLKLPERSVYFLDPNTRRLIMISNRENRGENKTPDKYGLFAEIVELDEEGKPHYRLSSSEIILPDDNYYLVAVGPNSYGLPPSHIDVVEGEETEFRGQGVFERGREMLESEAEKGKKRIAPWNVYLGQLQLWMNEVKINPGEDLEEFVKRFSELRQRNESKIIERIKRVFPEGEQGFSERLAPVNMIITDKGKDSFLYKSSVDVGLYPILISPESLLEKFQRNMKREDAFEENYIAQYLPSYPGGNVSVITRDWEAIHRTDSRYHFLWGLAHNFMKYNPIFSLVDLQEGHRYEADELDPRKFMHGNYMLPSDEVTYRGVLNKIKADLLLTMFLRGGAPLTK